MKHLLIVAALFGAGYFAWQKWSDSQSPIVRLSIFVDEHVDKILGPLPLDQKGLIPAPSYTHELVVLREDVKDLRSVASANQALRCSTAVKLCDELVSASQERDRHLARINDTRSKNNVSPLAVDPERHRAERLAYFENGIAMSWMEVSTEFRSAIGKRYAQLREFERTPSRD